MKPHVEAWARYCATHKYSARMTLEYAMIHNRAVLSVATWGPKCEVCGGLLQIGYKVQLPTDKPRVFTVGYIHTHPDWCERSTEAKRLMEAVEAAFRDVDQEMQTGAQFDNPLLAVSSRIALAWIDSSKEDHHG